MLKTYHTCAKVRRDIDRVLHTNAKLFQEGVANAKKIERDNLEAIKHLDPDFISFLLDASDNA